MKRHKWDVFISHASEDKDAFVRPFVRCLVGFGLSVWYDELVMYPGDSLRRSIDEGLVRCNYVVTVLSQAFFKKKWTQHELAGIFSRETRDQKIVIPVAWGHPRLP